MPESDKRLASAELVSPAHCQGASGTYDYAGSRRAQSITFIALESSIGTSSWRM